MPQTPMRLIAPLVAAIGLAGCTSENPVQPIQPPPTPTAPAPAPPTPTPVPPPATEPPAPGPTPRPNRPPTVTITGGGSCHPKVGQPCAVEFAAEVQDRDGDSFRLQWAGCTSGSGVTELCTIARPGEHTATVVVTDARGATAHASATALGTNLPPIVRIQGPADPSPSNTFYPLIGDEPYDPDDWPPYMNLACPTARVTVTGACVGGLAWCGGIANAFDIDLRTTTGPGTCTVEATVTDPWGAVGRDGYSFRVLPP